jgi:hypothetical protein
MSRIGSFTASLVLALSVLVVADEASRAAVNASERPRLTPMQAISIANTEAQRQEFRLSEFEAPSVQFKDPEGVWEVFYSGKSHLVDDCFSVKVNDRTGKATLFICA